MRNDPNNHIHFLHFCLCVAVSNFFDVCVKLPQLFHLKLEAAMSAKQICHPVITFQRYVPDFLLQFLSDWMDLSMTVMLLLI